MMMSGQPQPAEDDLDALLGEAVDAYLAAIRGGESCTPEEWAGRYPRIAAPLQECLEAMSLLRGISPGLSDLAPLRGSIDRSHEPSAAVYPHARGYTILSEIGRGGMGVVYRALQHTTKRIVALKFLQNDAGLSTAARRRFEREVELAASLDHPGIVRILESGRDQGRDYFAMEYIDGRPLNQWVSESWSVKGANADQPRIHSNHKPVQASIRSALRLFAVICDAVHYAHQRGVIHRDLKPGNIIVDAEGRPRILDFGLARTLQPLMNGAVTTTQSGLLVGTLPYLSPEQAAGGSAAIDVRSDVYSLGVILYELMTGRPPYDTDCTLIDALQHIVHTLPHRPSHFCPALRSDFDAVVLKALEKKPENRFQSAAALAEDVRCLLRGEPVDANRSTHFYLLRKAYARHRRQVQLAGAAMGLVLVASSIITGLYLQVRRQRNSLKEQLHVAQLHRGLAHLAAGHDHLAESLLSAAYSELPDRAATWSLISYFIQNPVIVRFEGTGWVTSAAFSPDGRFLAYGDLGGAVVVRDARSWAVCLQERRHASGIRALAFDPSSKWLATGGMDGSLLAWRTDTWNCRPLTTGTSGGVVDLRFASQKGQMLVARSDGRLELWSDIDNAATRPRILSNEMKLLVCADVTPDGQTIAASTGTDRVRVFGLTADPTISLQLPLADVESVRFDPAGRHLAAWNSSGVSVFEVPSGRKLWSAPTGLSEPRPTSLWDLPADTSESSFPLPKRRPHICWKPTLLFSPDGALLICTGWDAIVRVWDAATGDSRGALRSHGTAVYAAAMAPQTQYLAVSSIDQLSVWDVRRSPGVMSWPAPPGSHRVCAAISSVAGKFAWAGGSDGAATIVTLENTRQSINCKVGNSPVSALAFSPNGRRLAGADREGSIALWDTADGRILRRWSSNTTHVQSIVFSSDCLMLAAGGRDGKLRVWHADDGTELREWPAHVDQVLTIAAAPKGQRFLSGGTDWMAKLWDMGQEKPVAEWAHREWVNAACFSADGRLLATSGADLIIRISHSDGRRLVDISPSHAHWVNALAFLDRDRVLVSGGNDGAIRFWECPSGAELSTVPSWGGPVQTLQVSEDGRWLAVGAVGGVQLIDLGAAQDAITRRPHIRKEEATRLGSE